MTTVAQLDELLALGFIQDSDYERRKAALCVDGLAMASSGSLLVPGTTLASSPSSFASSVGEHVTVRPPEASIALRLRSKDERVVRVFVSSTLRHALCRPCDMEEERRLLVHRVFPALKAACRERRVAFSYVDFQWGITDEAAKDGQVIALCLREVDRCRPYVVAMLGERYGWAHGGPGSIPDPLLTKSMHHASEQYAWVAHYADRSVTELELLYGALFFPAHAEHALIYLRDPEYSRTHEHLRKLAAKAENDYDAQRLRALKAALRQSGLPVRDNYTSPEVFADHVQSDLLAAIERHVLLTLLSFSKSTRDFPHDELPDDDALSVEARHTQQFVTDEASLFVGREGELASLHAFVRDSSTTPLLLVGEEGAGKTALLARFVQELASHSEGTMCVPLFIGLHHSSMAPIVNQLLSHLIRHFALATTLPEEATTQLLLLSSWLRSPPFTTERPCVIVLDSLDALADDDGAASLAWLPPRISAHFRLILSSPSPRALVHVRQLYSSLPLLSLPPLPDVARRSLIETTLAPLAKSLSSAHTHTLVTATCAGSPLFLRNVLHHLATLSSHDDLTATLDVLVRVRDLDVLYERLLDAWEAQCGALLRDVLSLLALSHAGLVEAELVAIGPPRVPHAFSYFMIAHGHAQVEWARVWAIVGEGVRSTAGVLTLASSHLKRAVSERYLHGEPTRALRERLIAYCATKSGVGRLLREHVHQLLALQRPQALLAFLSGPHALALFELLYTPLSKDVLFAAWQSSGSPTMSAYVYETALLTHSCEPRTQVRLLGLLAAFLREGGHVTSARNLSERYVAQAKAVFGATSAEHANALFAHASLLVEAAQYDEARLTLKACKAIRHGVLAQAECAWLEALVCKKLGDYAHSKDLYAKALKGATEVLGQGHPTVALYRHTLGDVLRKQGAYDEAERVYQQALDVMRQHYGESNSAVAELLDALGRVHKKQGKYHAAEERFHAARNLVAHTHGAAHALYAQCTFNLGDVRRKLADYPAATRHYEEALELFRQLYGKAHPETAEALNALGDVDRLCGRLTQAAARIEEAIAIASRALGAGTEKVARFTCNLAAVHTMAARYAEAAALYSRALVVQERVLGSGHPDTAETLSALGGIEKKRGHYDNARALYERALAAVEQALGPGHVKVAQCAYELGGVCRKLKLRDAAFAGYERARDIYSEALGPQSPPVADVLNGLGLLLKTLGGNELDQAERYHAEALSIFERTGGVHHEKVALTLNYLAEVARKQGKFDYDGAEALYERALRINRSLFGDEHPEVAENLNGLAQVYTMQLNYDKAEPLFVQAIATTERTLGSTHPHVLNRYRNLLRLYERTGNVDKSMAVQDKIAALQPRVGM